MGLSFLEEALVPWYIIKFYNEFLRDSFYIIVTLSILCIYLILILQMNKHEYKLIINFVNNLREPDPYIYKDPPCF